MPFQRTFHICLARNSPVENSTGDDMAWRRRRSQSMHDLMHSSSLRSRLRTYERLTCSTSKGYPPFEQLGPGHLRKSALVSDLRGKSLKCRFNKG